MTKASLTNTKSRKTSLLSKLLRYGLPLLISIGLCYVLFHGLDFRSMIDFVKMDCDFSYILLSMLLTIPAYMARGYRWRLQLRASGINPPAYAMFYSIAGTYAVNLVFPRLGEVWRSEYLAQRQKTPFVTVLGSMISDRLADTLTVFLLLVATFFLAGSAVEGFINTYPATYESVSRLVSSPLTYIVLAAVIGFGVFFFRHKWSNRYILKIRQQFHNLGNGFMAIFHMKGKGKWLLLTVVIWGIYFTQLWIGMQAFGFTREIVTQHGIIVVLVCFVLSSLSMGIPSQGGFGPYQLAIMFGLSCFEAGISEEKAGALANVLLGAQTLMTIAVGLVTFALIAVDNRRLSKTGK